jgi:uncharacterized protein HemX
MSDSSKYTMENTPQNPSNKASEAFSETYHAHVAPLLAMLVVVLVLIMGGLYLWGALLSKESQTSELPRTLPNNEPETTRAQADAQILNTMSPSTEIDAIYADLESTNLDSLDTELDVVVSEMD